MSGRYDVKSGFVFLCADVLGRNCFLDVYARGVLLRFLAAASTICVTLLRGDCLSRRKAVSRMRGCMSIAGIVGDCIATLFPLYGLDCSSVDDCEYAGGVLVTSRFAGAEEVIVVSLLVAIDAVIRLTAGMGVKLLEGAGKKLIQSS